MKKKLLPKNQQPCHAICVPQKENGDPSTREWATKIKSMAHVCDSDQKHAQIIEISWCGALVHARNSIEQFKKLSRFMVAIGHLGAWYLSVGYLPLFEKLKLIQADCSQLVDSTSKIYSFKKSLSDRNTSIINLENSLKQLDSLTSRIITPTYFQESHSLNFLPSH